MRNLKLFCFGFGQVAKYFVNKLINEKYNLEVVTTNTEETKKIIFKNKQFNSFFFKSESLDNQLIPELIPRENHQQKTNWASAGRKDELR